jgi:hypothetical protein
MASVAGSTEQPPAAHGHSFCKKTFHKPTYCHHCSDMLWGLIQQGFICEGEPPSRPSSEREIGHRRLPAPPPRGRLPPLLPKHTQVSSRRRASKAPILGPSFSSPASSRNKSHRRKDIHTSAPTTRQFCENSPSCGINCQKFPKEETDDTIRRIRFDN